MGWDLFRDMYRINYLKSSSHHYQKKIRAVIECQQYFSLFFTLSLHKVPHGQILEVLTFEIWGSINYGSILYFFIILFLVLKKYFHTVYLSYFISWTMFFPSWRQSLVSWGLYGYIYMISIYWRVKLRMRRINK